MVIATLIIGVIGLYLSFIMMKNGWVRRILVLIFGVTLVGSLYLINANDASHFGMKQVTTSSTRMIVSASPSKNLPLLLRQNIGTNGKRQVYLYKLSSKGKTQHTKADYLVTNRVVAATGDTATLKTTKTQWVYSSDFYQRLFANQNNHMLIKETNTIAIPKTWASLTTTQAKALAKKLQALQKPSAADQAKMATVIEGAVAAAKSQNPNLTAEQIAQVTAQAKAKLQQAAIQSAIESVKESEK